MQVSTVLFLLPNIIKMGKNSFPSRLNIPGKLGWATMEAPGFISLLVTMTSVQRSLGIESLPRTNWLMASLYTMHYVYRALISPLLLAPSMSPMHISVWLAALVFQVLNGACIGGWLGGYGPTSAKEWEARMGWIQVGLVMFLCGFVGNVYHDDELRDLRRSEPTEREKVKEKKEGEDKVYKVPQAGLFQYILYPHYFCEWIEWLGYWMIGGAACMPARNFLASEIATMLPQAMEGRRWYLRKFGKEKIGERKAILPGLL